MVGQVVTNYDQNRHAPTKIYALDLNHLIIKNFVNRLDVLNENEKGEAKGYFIVGYQSLSVNLTYNDTAGGNVLMNDRKMRQNLFVEAEQKGKYVKYPNYADLDDPVKPFNNPTDIILE